MKAFSPPGSYFIASKFLSLLLIFITNICVAQQQDASFGNNGRVIDASARDEILYNKTIILQPDNKIIVSGYDDDAFGYSPTLFVKRYNADGSKDSTFLFKRLSGSFPFANLLSGFTALQPGGKILVAARESDRDGENIFHLYLQRCLPDGSPDSSFGTNGLIAPYFQVGNVAVLTLTNQNKILAGGTLYRYNADSTIRNNFLLARFTEDGKLDSSFANDGAILKTSPYEGHAFGIKILSDDKFLIAHRYYDGQYKGSLIKYNANGSIDSSFGTNGVVLNSNEAGSGLNGNASLIIQPDGKILESVVLRQSTTAIFRYNANGTPDLSFGTNGKTDSITSGYLGSAADIALQSDGKILATVTYPGNKFFSVIRYNSNGKVDQTFGNAGVYAIDFLDMAPTASQGFAQRIMLLPSNKVLVSGKIYDQGVEELTLAQFINETAATTTIQLTAKPKQNSIVLQWTASKQQNIILYDVERSDGKTGFNNIGRVVRKTGASAAYRFEDNNPLSGDNYYRLKVIKRDRSFYYSDTVSSSQNIITMVTANDVITYMQSKNFSVFPNPAKNLLHINQQGKSAFTLINQSGRIVLSKTINGNDVLNVSSLSAGIYYLKNVDTNEVKKLIISK